MANQLMYGSICLTDLIEAAKKGHGSFSRAANGKVYCNVNVWINDAKDQYGNDASIQATYKDAAKDDKFYFGNLKKSDYNGSASVEAGAADVSISDDDLPF